MKLAKEEITFAQAKSLISWVSPIAIVGLGAFSGFLIGTTQTEAQVVTLQQTVDRHDRMFNGRTTFMECAIREIDRIDIQSKDPDHEGIPARCNLEIPERAM